MGVQTQPGPQAAKLRGVLELEQHMAQGRFARSTSLSHRRDVFIVASLQHVGRSMCRVDRALLSRIPRPFADIIVRHYV